jgi:tetratricopeptide (TPR) repeat protein
MSQLGGIAVIAVIAVLVISFMVADDDGDSGSPIAITNLPEANASQPVEHDDATSPKSAENEEVATLQDNRGNGDSAEGHAGTGGEEVGQIVNELEKRLIESPGDLDLILELGAYYFELRIYPRAADMFAAALEINPNDAAVRSDLASSFLYQGMVGIAQKEYQAAIELDPELADAYFNLGVSYSHGRTQDIEAAIAAWEQVMELEPESEIAKTAEGYIREYRDDGDSGTPDSAPVVGG